MIEESPLGWSGLPLIIKLSISAIGFMSTISDGIFKMFPIAKIILLKEFSSVSEEIPWRRRLTIACERICAVSSLIG